MAVGSGILILPTKETTMKNFDRTNPIISAQLRELRWKIGYEFYGARRGLSGDQLEAGIREWLVENLHPSWKGETRQQIIDAAVEDMMGPKI